MGYDSRGEDRYDVHLEADLRGNPGEASPVRITNLSSRGCRFASARKSPLGSLITIAVGRIGHLEAEVKWRAGDTYGVRFDHPLPQVFLDHMRLFLSKEPALVAERQPTAV